MDDIRRVASGEAHGELIHVVHERNRVELDLHAWMLRLVIGNERFPPFGEARILRLPARKIERDVLREGEHGNQRPDEQRQREHYPLHCRPFNDTASRSGRPGNAVSRSPISASIVSSSSRSCASSLGPGARTSALSITPRRLSTSLVAAQRNTAWKLRSGSVRL